MNESLKCEVADVDADVVVGVVADVDADDESLSQVMLLMMRLLPLRPMCMTPPVQNDWQT